MIRFKGKFTSFNNFIEVWNKVVHGYYGSTILKRGGVKTALGGVEGSIAGSKRGYPFEVAFIQDVASYFPLRVKYNDEIVPLEICQSIFQFQRKVWR